MCCELLDCGNVSSPFRERASFSARSLDEQTNAASSRKGRLMGEARRRQRDQGTMWERWNLPTISTGTTGKRNVRFAGFSLLLGNREAPTHWYWCYWEWARDDIPEKLSWGLSHIQTSTAAQMLNSAEISLTKTAVLLGLIFISVTCWWINN